MPATPQPADAPPPDPAAPAADASGYLARWAAHTALGDAAAAVVADLAALDGCTAVLLVEDRDLLGRDGPHRQVRWQLDHHERALRRGAEAVEDAVAALDPTGTDPGPAAGHHRAVQSPVEALAAQATSVADVLGLLRPDYTVAAADVPARTPALTAAVAGRLLGTPGSPTVVLDRFRLLEAGGPVGAALGDAVRAADDLAAAHRQLRDLLGRRQGHDAGPAVAQGAEREAEAAALLAAWDAALTTLVTAPPGGVAPLEAAAVQAAVHGTHPPVSHVVALSLDSSGADVVTRRSLFGPSGRLWLVGGVTASWLALRTADGVLVTAGSSHHGRRIAYDLGTGAHQGEPIAGSPAASLPSSGLERWQRALVGALAVTGIGWVVADAVSKLG